jgi:Leucine-rich repeat (LRR) protein
MLQLDLSSNRFSEPMQEFDTHYSHMIALYLGRNQISGQIPASFFQLTSLGILDISSNNLTGLVQLSSLLKLRKLSLLDLSDNKLSVLDGEGSKPMLPVFPKLWKLQLISCNMTTIPRLLMHLNHIAILDLSRNKIHGLYPNGYGRHGMTAL